MRPDQLIKERVDNLRLAAKYNPFDHNERIMGANYMAVVALMSHDQGWLNAAKAEVRYRLATDSTDASLLSKGILLNLELGDVQEADFYYQQLQRVNRKSPFMKLVAKATNKGAAPSPPTPDGYLGATR